MKKLLGFGLVALLLSSGTFSVAAISAQRSSLAGMARSARSGGSSASAQESMLAITCEAWVVRNSTAQDQLDALTAEVPANADAVRDLLEASGAGVERAVRFVTTTADGAPARYSEQEQIPFLTTTTSTSSTQTTLGGSSEAGTDLQITSNVAGGIAFTQLNLQVSSFGKQSERVLPPMSNERSFTGTIQQKVGSWSVVQAASRESGSLVILLQVDA